MRDLKSEIHEALQSNFVDVYSLRGLIIEAGYVPEKDRCKIWNILINGLITEDIESLTFKPSDKNISSYNNLLQDCDEFIATYSRHCSSRGGSLVSFDCNSLKGDAIDILVLYLIRRGMPYSKLMVPFLIVVLFSSNRHAIPRSLASSCFYSYANTYQPLLQLDPSSCDVSLDTLHFYTRLLLTYHNPKLGLHLDQIFPGWEQSHNSIVLDINDDKDTSPMPSNSNSNHSNGSSRNSSSHAKKINAVGFIPNEWLVGCLLSSVPIEVGAMIMDWIILNEEKYAGLYLTVAFLLIFSDALLEMDKEGVLAWQKQVDSGVINWTSHSNSSISFAASPKNGTFGQCRP